jgi:uncharacterized membrane protein (UPF0127 family)
MSSLARIVKAVRDFLVPPSREGPKGPLQVVNVTRGTKLATRLEAAHTGPARRKGLLGRDGLLPGEGLWIAPCESVHTFFMRFDIDLVYLDREHRIKKVRHAVGPWRVSACFTAHSILELPAGTVRETRSTPGDALEITPAADSD